MQNIKTSSLEKTAPMKKAQMYRLETKHLEEEMTQETAECQGGGHQLGKENGH